MDLPQHVRLRRNNLGLLRLRTRERLAASTTLSLSALRDSIRSDSKSSIRIQNTFSSSKLVRQVDGTAGPKIVANNEVSVLL